MIRVLVACEFSGVVRDAFRAEGHDAWSCDLLPTETPGPHIEGDVLTVLGDGWDLMIAHPPCTYLANSGARWLYVGGRGNQRDAERWKAMEAAADFYNCLRGAPIPRIALENPLMHGHAAALIPGRKAESLQIIQPWQFGHGEIKATCFDLINLPPLRRTKEVSGRKARVHLASPGPDRWKERSRTLPGVAEAMAVQWGTLAAMTRKSA